MLELVLSSNQFSVFLANSGSAPVGTACGKYIFGQTAKIGIVEDHGAFDGVGAVAHAMGSV